MPVMRPNLAFMHNTCSWAVLTIPPAAASPPPFPYPACCAEFRPHIALSSLFIIQQKDSLCARERCTSASPFQPSVVAARNYNRFILLACDSGKMRIQGPRYEFNACGNDKVRRRRLDCRKEVGSVNVRVANR